MAEGRDPVPTDALEDVAYLARSANRFAILDALTEGPATRRAVAERTGASRRTLDWIVNELEARGWAERTTDGDYVVTPTGRRIMAQMRPLVDAVEAVRRLDDADASLNPIYGQGMSVAALEALVLHHTLAAGGREDLGDQFFARAEDVVDTAWGMAVGMDSQFPQTTGPKPRGTDLFGRYLSRLIRKAHSNGDLRDALFSVIMMEHPRRLSSDRASSGRCIGRTIESSTRRRVGG